MTGISLDISNRINRTLIDCLSALQAEAYTLGLDILLVGATVRELLLGGYGITGRATEDIDIGIAVGNWGSYQTFISSLIADGSFTRDTNRNNRLLFAGAVPVDMIPFGGIEAPDGTIAWPDNEGCIMRVTGFKDAHKHALTGIIGKGKQIPVASLPGMAVLKIIAWDDRHIEFPTKDAEDLAAILHNYAHAGNTVRLYDKFPEIITDLGGDLEPAGARLLGIDMSAIMSRKTKETVTEILERNTIPEHSDTLVEALCRHLPGSDYERALYMLQNMKKGIEIQL